MNLESLKLPNFYQFERGKVLPAGKRITKAMMNRVISEADKNESAAELQKEKSAALESLGIELPESIKSFNAKPGPNSSAEEHLAWEIRSTIADLLVELTAKEKGGVGLFLGMSTHQSGECVGMIGGFATENDAEVESLIIHPSLPIEVLGSSLLQLTEEELKTNIYISGHLYETLYDPSHKIRALFRSSHYTREAYTGDGNKYFGRNHGPN